MEAELTHQLFESGSPLGLAGNVFEDGGIGEHEGAVVGR